MNFGLSLPLLVLLLAACWLLYRLLRHARRQRLASSALPLASRIDAILPQTQCGQCGYAGCQPYADALTRGEERINRCPPGGEQGIRQLAALLQTDYLPFAADGPQPKPKAVALIDESSCIGCTLCIQACPVDAILGSAKQMHTVLAAECTGCELCLPPCPVDCISMRPVNDSGWRWAYPVIAIQAVLSDGASRQQQAADIARQRYRFRQSRLQREQQEKAQRLAERAAQQAAKRQASPAAAGSQNPTTVSPADKQAAIAAAMARASQRQQAQASAEEGQLDEREAAIAANRQAAIEAAMARAAARKAAQDAAKAATPSPTAVSEQQALIQAAMARAAAQKSTQATPPSTGMDQDKQALIQAAMTRAAARKAEQAAGNGDAAAGQE